MNSTLGGLIPQFRIQKTVTVFALHSTGLVLQSTDLRDYIPENWTRIPQAWAD